MTPIFIPVDAKVKIDLQLENPPRILCTLGSVRWVKNIYSNEMFEVGINFIDPSFEFRKAIRSHVEKLKLEKFFEDEHGWHREYKLKIH